MSLRAALFLDPLSQDQPTIHSLSLPSDFPTPLICDRPHLWFSCPSPMSDRDRKACQLPFGCPWGNWELFWSRDPASRFLFPLPPSLQPLHSDHSSSQTSRGHAAWQESSALTRVEREGCQTLPMWRAQVTCNQVPRK